MNNQRPTRQHNKATAPFQPCDLRGNGSKFSRNLSIDLQARALHALWTSGLSIALFVLALVGSAIALLYLIESGTLSLDLQELSMLYAYILPVALLLLGLALKKNWDSAMQPKPLRAAKRQSRNLSWKAF